MNKKVRKFRAKYWITIWLVISIILIAAIGAFAVYAEVNNKMRRVVTPSEKKESLFTSNLLASGSSNFKYVYFNAESTPYNYDVVIRNFSPLDPGRIYDKEIQYTFVAELVHKNGSAYNESEASSMNGGSIYLSCGNDTYVIDADTISIEVRQAISGLGDSGRKTWHVEYSNIPLGSDYCLKITAAPDDPHLQDISATIVIDNYPAVNREGWSCSLVESGDLSAYDAFNYTIIGTGSANLIFSYDESKVTINPAFYSINDEVDAPIVKNGSWKSVVIHANSELTNNNRYDIQVFKINSFQPSSAVYIDPNEDGSYVTFEVANYTPPT